MKALNVQEILDRANELYAEAKIPENRLRYMAPETRPAIQSDQVKCVLKALVEAINAE